MELAGWTNDRLVVERLSRLPRSEWVFGRANSSVVMAAFLHAAPEGGRFSGPDLGAWYAADSIETGIAEVAHHMRREAYARGVPAVERQFRVYMARLEGRFIDLCGSIDPALGDSERYGASQLFGETARARGEDGILYPSLRFAGGLNACAYRPSKVLEVTQAQHLAIAARTDDPRISVEVLGQN